MIFAIKPFEIHDGDGGCNRRICKKPSHGEESGSACVSQLCGEKVQLSGTRIPDQGDSATDKRRTGNCT